MKISTESIDIELSIDEFEQIIDKDLLDSVITMVISLSAVTETCISCNDESLLQSLNSILTGDNNCMSNDDSDEEYDEEDDNFIVDQLYDNLFGSGEET